MSINNVTFEDWKAEQLQDPEYRAALEELEAGYQVTRLRIMRGLTQGELAKLVGTWQPSIAWLESGRREPRISFLRRVVKALGARLEIRIVLEEEGQVIEPLVPVVSDSNHTDSVAAEEVKQRLRVKAAEARRRALEYDGDPIEDLRHILPDDFPAELWQEIIDGEYDDKPRAPTRKLNFREYLGALFLWRQARSKKSKAGREEDG